MLITVICVAAGLLTSAQSAAAAILEVAPAVSVPYEQTLSQNLYLAAGSASVNGEAVGDVVGIASALTIDGTVREDLTAAAASAQLAGVTDGDVRIVAGDVRVSGRVAGDLLVLGGTVDVMPSAAVAGDTVILAGDVTVDGTLGEHVHIIGGSISFNGSARGDVFIRGTGGVTFGEASDIGGSLTYQAPDKQALPQSARIAGELTYEQTTTLAPFDTAFFGFAVLLELLALAVATLIFIHILPAIARDIGEYGVPHFGWNVLYGVLFIALLPLIIVLLAASILGFYLALIFAALYIVLLVSAAVGSGVLVGALLSRAITESVQVNWKWALVGIAVLAAVSLIPIVGWAAAVVAYCATIGTFTRIGVRAVRRHR